MNKQFDPQQQIILDSSSQNQLVSASAGSGKTTVMIQKITNLLLNNIASTDEILVVTFTNLASVEMKERLITNLTKALINASENDKSRIQNMLDNIETAAVDTIDGFCSKMLKKYFYKTNLDPELKIISSFSQEYYINKALDLAIHQYGSQNENELIILCDIFEKKSRSLDNLKESLLKAFNFCICQKDYYSFLDNVLGQYKDLNTPSSKYLNQYICKKIQSFNGNILRALPNLTDYPNLHKMLDNYTIYLLQIKEENGLLDNAKSLNLCPVCNFKSCEDVDKTDISFEQVKHNIEQIKKFTASIKFLNNLDNNIYLNFISNHLSSFISLLRQFIDCYTSLKKENNVMDFGDLERKMLTILEDKEILENFHNNYKYIFVDEYQDINPMQDELIKILLSNTSNLFLVGDVKQSIYGFRQSSPELFIKAYKDYKKDNSNGSAFDMNINFRSAPEILKFNNEIFSCLMTEQDADIDYNKTSKFEPRREDFPNDRAVEILIANSDIEAEENVAKGIYSVNQHVNPSNSILAEELEANIVINKIQSLVGKEFYDSNMQKSRKLEYEDIAILTRSISNDKVQNLAKLLTENNIPININKLTNLKDSEIIAKIISLLRAINFTASDIDYTYFFTSPLVKLSYDKLLQVYTNKELDLYTNLKQYVKNNSNAISMKINNGFNILDKFRLASSTLNIVELIEHILNKYHLRQYIIASEKGFEQLNMLNEFLSSLSNEEKNLTIPKFIDLIEKNLSSKSEFVFRDSTNSVTIQTIHASKGLEYPVVILFNSSQQFKYLTEYPELNFDTSLGIGMQYYDLEKRKRYESPTRFAIKIKNREKGYKEELRLLYVATTRAKNKLIITGCCSEEKLKNNTLTKDNYLNLILSCFYNKIIAQPLLNNYKFANCDIKIYNNLENYKNLEKIEKKLINNQIISNNINFSYPYIEETNISIKNNVTALSRTLNEDYNIIPIKLNLNENLQAINDDLAQIGTQYHNVLSNIIYSNPYIYIKEDNIDENLIKKAYDTISPLSTNCINQYSEKQFMMYIPYNEIYPESNISTKILIQGVIDLILEFENHVILIDYKYSNLPINKLASKYKTQLDLYKMALQKALKKPVINSYIYSIKTGELG